MKRIILSPILLISLSCLSQSKSDSPRQLQEGIYLKEGGRLDSLYTRGILVRVNRTMWGFKHLFIADSGDSLQVYYQKRLKLNECYQIPNKL